MKKEMKKIGGVHGTQTDMKTVTAVAKKDIVLFNKEEKKIKSLMKENSQFMILISFQRLELEHSEE